MSEEAKTLLRERVGYRCEEFRGSRVTRATDVIRFEVDELGNEHILDELREVLGLPRSATLEQSLSAVRDRFGEDSKAVWLGTEEAVRELYCGVEEEPIAVEIPGNAVLVSDLGYDGQLFLFPERGRGTTEWAETGKIEAETRRDVERIFEEKRRRLGVDARLDLHVKTVEVPPIVGENVYGEAFPSERPPRVWLEVFALDATTQEITKIVCEELLHIKHPELSEEEVAREVLACVKEPPKRMVDSLPFGPTRGAATACEARWSDEPNLLYPHSVVQLSPQAFLDLCPPLPYTHENLKSMVADVVGELKTKGRYKPFLKVNLSGQVLDHEGRIRAIAAARLGCREIPVEVYFYDEEYYEFIEPPKKLPPLKTQRWREFHMRRGEPVPPTHTFYVAGLTVRMLGPGL